MMRWSTLFGVECLMLFLYLCLVLDNACGFASNLVITQIGCMTDLDTSEVIMNNVVRAAEDSDFPKMHLAVVIDDNHMASPYHYSSEDLSIAFVNPYTHDEFPDDLQFVIQLEGEGAEFVDGGTIGCENNHRVSARLNDDGGRVALQIHDTSASFKMWAGWATGQNAVRLTPPLLLKPHLGEAPNIQDELEETNQFTAVENDGVTASISRGPLGGSRKASDEQATAAVKTKERRMGHTKEKMKKRSPKLTGDFPPEGSVENDSDIEIKKRRRPLSKQKMTKKTADQDFEKENEAKEEPLRSPVAVPGRQPNFGASPTNKPVPEWQRIYDQWKQRKVLEAEMERNFPDQNSFRYRYNRGVEMHMSNHICACIFFLIAMCALHASFGSRREKGRRDL